MIKNTEKNKQNNLFLNCGCIILAIIIVLLIYFKIRDARYNGYQQCLASAEKVSSEMWNNDCKKYGLPNGCKLPRENAKFLNDILWEVKFDCFDSYKKWWKIF